MREESANDRCSRPEFVIACMPQYRQASDPASNFSETTGHNPSISLNLDGFSILAWHGGALVTPDQPGIGLTFMLHGNIYDLEGESLFDWPSQVARLYRSGTAENLGRRLRGSFVLLIIDHIEDKLVLITDRAGTLKVFSVRDQNALWLSSTTSLLPTRAADPAGVVSYMVNDFIHSGRTLLAGVSLLKRANIHIVDRNGLSSRPYWEFLFSERHAGCDTRDLQDQYSWLMRQAIRRRVPADGRIFISLSGGIDSRAVLGLLVSEPGIKERLVAFSYGTPTDQDVITSRRVCDFLGIKHHHASFQGDLPATIRRNGALCEGLVSFYTHGIDGLYAMAPEFVDGKALFVGDIAFRQGDEKFVNFDDMLSRGVGIHSPFTVPAYFGFGAYRTEDMENELAKDIDVIKARCSDISDLAASNQFLLLDQRQCYMLLPWREFYAGRFLPVANPLIDEDIIEFAAGIPGDQRHDKRLHRDTVLSMFPDLCKLGIAKSGVDNNPVHVLLRVQRKVISELATSYESHLDEVVPPQMIHAALASLIHRMRPEHSGVPRIIRSIAGAILHRHLQARMHRSSGQNITVGGTPAIIPHLSARQIEKLLAIRYFLRKKPVRERVHP